MLKSWGGLFPGMERVRSWLGRRCPALRYELHPFVVNSWIWLSGRLGASSQEAWEFEPQRMSFLFEGNQHHCVGEEVVFVLMGKECFLQRFFDAGTK